MSDNVWKIGELASRTGLSVRTLHYYDEIDLLRPSRRTASSHRLYAAAEVRRLQQIKSLGRMYSAEPDIAVDRGFTFDPALASFVGKALAAQKSADAES